MEQEDDEELNFVKDKKNLSDRDKAVGPCLTF